MEDSRQKKHCGGTCVMELAMPTGNGCHIAQVHGIKRHANLPTRTAIFPSHIQKPCGLGREQDNRTGHRFRGLNGYISNVTPDDPFLIGGLACRCKQPAVDAALAMVGGGGGQNH